jgi:hypothetical protein
VSRENLERIREGFAAHNRGDLDALVEFYDPEAVFETLLLGTHHGNEAIRLICEENQVGSGPASRIAVDEPFAFVSTFKGKRVVREQAF